MGASQKKQRRIENREEGLDKKARKLAEEQRAREKAKVKHTVIGVVTVLLVAVIIVFGSNILYKYFGAVKAGDVRYSSADYSYYYTTTYNNYYNTYYSSYGDYAKYFMPGEDKLKEETLSTMQEVAMLVNEARAAGFTLPQKGLDSISEALAAYQSAADEYGYASLGSFLATVYGRGMSVKTFRENMTDYLTASYYAQEIRDSYTYTPDELSAYYDEHRDEYDNFTFRYFYFDGSAVEADEEKGIEAVESEAAMAAAKEKADEFLGKITDEDSFVALAYSYADEDSKPNYENAGYTLATYQGAYISSGLSAIYDWIAAQGRKEGDTTVAESGSGYYVVYYISRADNDYATMNARHILIKPEAVDKSDYVNDEKYQEAVEAADKAAKAKAEEVYAEWKSGEMTQDSFAALAGTYSGDAGSSGNGGLYENIYKGQMVTEFENWVFDASRKAGDTGIIQTSHGYHIMYFAGADMTYNDYLADEDKRTEEYDAWKTGKVADYPLSTTWLLDWGTRKAKSGADAA